MSGWDVARDSQGGVETFAVLLRRLRHANGLSQEELASRSGLSANAVGALERGQRRHPYPHTVSALAEAMALNTEQRATLQAAVPARGRQEQAKPAAPEAATGGRLALPRPPTRLVGRERELAELAELIGSAEVRLITLTGIGGVGKTRLALEAARRAAASFSGGAVFVRLAPLTDAALLTSAVLRSLGAIATEAQSPAEAIIGYLRDEELLLILDNFEHLLQAAPEVAQWLESSPGLTVLATSRAPLRLRAEIEYQVPPLSLPSSSRTLSADEVLDSASGALFVERAGASAGSYGFALTEANASDVASICWRLAGLPLALELAAAKARLLEPAALLSRLDEALSASWSRDLPERQRTMRATLDWSYELLEEPQQRLLRELSVFAGSFTLEAAEAVGDAPKGAQSTLESLGALVEQSLVLARRETGHEGRYRMLEPVRQYAAERLGEGEEAAGARRRHAVFFLELAERASAELWGPSQGELLERLDRDHDNLRSAISWALQTDETEIAGRMCWALWLFWWIRGYHREGRGLSEAALDRDLAGLVRTRVLPVAAAMAYTEDDFETAERHWREGLILSVREGDTLGEGYSRAGAGLAELVRGDYEKAGESFEAALPILEYCEDEALATLVSIWLGTTLLMRGDPSGAERSIRQGLSSARSREDALCIYVALYNMAQLALSRGELESATKSLLEGVELSEHTRDRANLAHFLDALADVAALSQMAERAAVLTGAAANILREVGAPVYNFYRPDPALQGRAIQESRAALGAAEFEALRERGESMSFEQAVRYALA